MIPREHAIEFFKKTKSVKCPAFPKEEVFFNAKGRNHLFYKGSHGSLSKRNPKEVWVRVILLERALELLSKATVFQEEDTYDSNGKLYSFWGFEGVMDGRRIKVVVRQIGKGNKFFWSVVPFWRKDRFGKIKNSKKGLTKL